LPVELRARAAPMDEASPGRLNPAAQKYLIDRHKSPSYNVL
jgi:hypothetical protein